MGNEVVAEILRWHEATAIDGLAGGGVQLIEPLDAWAVHGYADVDRVLTEHEVFSSDELRYSAQPVPHRDNPILGSLLATDPPRHHVLRRIVSRAFTPRAVDALRVTIARTVHERLDAMDSDTAEMSVIEEIGLPLPVHTIAALLGVEAERQPDFVRWTEAITSFVGSFSDDPVRRSAFENSRAEMNAYFRDVFTAHRKNPSDDVISALLAAEPDGSRLTDDELINFCTLLLINGHETTKTLLVNTVLCLTEYPAALARLRSRPELPAGTLEEVLRFLPPVGGVDRFATRPTSMAGHRIEAGQRIIAMILSANRDQRVYVEPHRFDPERGEQQHLSFGHGVHFCLGAHLARQEVEIAIRIMLERIPGEWHLPPDGVDIQRTPVGIDIVKLALAWHGSDAVSVEPDRVEARLTETDEASPFRATAPRRTR